MQKRRLVQKAVVTITFMALLWGLGVTIAQAQTAAPKLIVKKGKDLRLEDNFTAANGGRWIKIHPSDYGITMAEETSMKSVGPDLREILTLSSGRGGLDVSLSRQVYNCRSAEYKEVETALVDANGRIGAWTPSPLANKMVELPYSYKYAISVFFHACFSKRNLMDIARTFPEAVTFLRNNTPKP